MNKQKRKKLLFLVPILLFVLLYAGGYTAQFLYNYSIWQQSGAMLGDGTAPEIPSFHILKCYSAVFHFPEGLYGIVICMAAIVILVLFVMKLGVGETEEYDRERNIIYSAKGTYGTAGYMTEREREKVLKLESPKDTQGIILGKLEKWAVCLPAETKMNRNIAVYGASGSMKSRAFARNMVLQAVKRKESLIITDPKSELYNDMSIYLENSGYVVKVFNLVNIENSDAWNCLAEIEGQEIMAQLFSDVIIKNTGSEKGDHFWDNSEQNLLKALILYVDTEYPEENRNIGEVYKLLTLSTEDTLNKLFELLPITHPAKSPYSIFKQAGESVRGGVIIGLGSRLQVFQNKMIRDITAYNEIQLELPGQQKCAYFCITSDQDSTFDFLSSLFFSFLFIKLVRLADKYGKEGKLKIPVIFLLDEFPNIGRIPDFKKKISTVRSRNIGVSMIFQNIAQLKNRYPLDEWQEIIGNCDTQLFLGCTDEMTAKFISDRTGEITIGVNSHSKELNTWRVSNYTPQYRETSSTGRRKLLTPDEVLRMPLEEALIILRGQKVLRVKKFDYTLHPESKKLISCNVTEHIPDWRKNIERLEPVFIPTQQKIKKNKKSAKQYPKKEDFSSELSEISQELAKEIEGNLQCSDLTEQTARKQITKADKDSIMS